MYFLLLFIIVASKNYYSDSSKACIIPVEYAQVEAWDQTTQQLFKRYIWTIHVVYHSTDNNEPLTLPPYTRQSTLLIVSSPWVSAPC